MITLDLLYDFPQQPKRESTIRFDGVRLYHFVHPAGAIITDIYETPLEALLREHAAEIADWAKHYGVNDWRVGIDELTSAYTDQGLRTWTIDSAIGFAGFVIGRSLA